MKLYPSFYTVAVPEGNELLLFNTRTLYFGRLDAALYRNVLVLVDDLNCGRVEKNSDEDVRSTAFLLRQKGFFVEDPVREREGVASRFERRRKSGGHLGLTIAPTLDCNFSCPYCYERPERFTMSPETVSRIAEYVEGELASGRYSSMHVTWYGGEPLLSGSFEVVVSLSEKLLAGCDFHGTAYSANIITNGYLLDRAKASRLAGLKVALAQITLDGPPELHDRTRIMKNGAGSFERIMRNIRSSRDFLRFSIRMNVNAGNADTVMDLKRVLRDEGMLDDQGRTALYVSPVRSYTSSCQGGDCLSNSAFYRLQLDLLRQGINDDGFQVVEEYPSLKESVCTAVGADSYVIGPSGELYKCWLDLGRAEHSVGMIGQNGPDLNERIARWTGFRPFDAGSDCAECDMLPVCMGGCPELNLRSRGGEDNMACCNWKYVLREHLLHIADRMRA
ncbi:MAG: SPASM domain-containing protein [Chlorobium phaeobacteroides]|uniref:Radical SAM domain protein n=1 Tax=Chlorobium phaeobacteroides (strain BS1) TaxID=331678 RepID=B3EJC4_CHLPB|nr:SPASM domain-containing protein [Chlorobium phaeobacteroides]